MKDALRLNGTTLAGRPITVAERKAEHKETAEARREEKRLSGSSARGGRGGGIGGRGGKGGQRGGKGSIRAVRGGLGGKSSRSWEQKREEGGEATGQAAVPPAPAPAATASQINPPTRYAGKKIKL